MTVASFVHPMVWFAGTEAGIAVFAVLATASGLTALLCLDLSRQKRTGVPRSSWLRGAATTASLCAACIAVIVVGCNEANAAYARRHAPELVATGRAIVTAEQRFYRATGRYSADVGRDLAPTVPGLRGMLDPYGSPFVHVDALSAGETAVVLSATVDLVGWLRFWLRDGRIVAVSCGGGMTACHHDVWKWSQ